MHFPICVLFLIKENTVFSMIEMEGNTILKGNTLKVSVIFFGKSTNEKAEVLPKEKISKISIPLDYFVPISNNSLFERY